jgi:hypothetical protein
MTDGGRGKERARARTVHSCLALMGAVEFRFMKSLPTSRSVVDLPLHQLHQFVAHRLIFFFCSFHFFCGWLEGVGGGSPSPTTTTYRSVPLIEQHNATASRCR